VGWDWCNLRGVDEFSLFYVPEIDLVDRLVPVSNAIPIYSVCLNVAWEDGIWDIYTIERY